MKRFAKKLLPLPAFLLILCLFAGSVSALDRPGLFPRKNEQETTSAEDRVPGQLYADDIEEIRGYVAEFCTHFGGVPDEILNAPFTVVTPDSGNPYKQMYVAN